jgi:phosphomannomutase
MTLMVGISGIRGIVGQTLTPAVALEFAQAFGTLLGGGEVVLARDSRPSGPMLESAVTAGLGAAGCQVTLLGLAMTPTVGRAIRDRECDGGMVITASHNPGQWNGLKFLDRLGVAPDLERARRIAEIRARGEYRLITAGFRPPQTDPQAGGRHVAAVRDACEVQPARLKRLRVVLDSVNGAGGVHTPALLAALGCETVHVNADPSGEFAHPPEPTRENLTGLGGAVREADAAVGFAQDPDGDRLAIVDENGEYIGEEYTLALAAQWVLSRRPGPVAANLSTSRMIDDLAAHYGVPVVRTPVGEAHVARAMLAHRCVVGGEGNGGVIDPRVCYVRDSLSAISLVVQLLAATGKSVSELVADLPRYATVKTKLGTPPEGVVPHLKAVAAAFADLGPNTVDGVRVDFPEGWVHLRASNTEPILRIIAEAGTDAQAAELVARVRAAAGL